MSCLLLIARRMAMVTVFAVSCSSFRAEAALIPFTLTMNGASESPANGSPATGTATITFDDVARTMRLQTSFSGLQGGLSAVHIHAPNALGTLGTGATSSGLGSNAAAAAFGTTGVASLDFAVVQSNSGTLVPLGSTSLSGFDQTYNMNLASGFGAGFLAAPANGGNTISAFNLLVSQAQLGRAYFNVHSASVPGGEIRGFLAAVPEPSSVALLSAVGVGLFGFAWRKRRKMSNR